MSKHGAECQDCSYFAHASKNGRTTRKTFGACEFVVNWPVKIPMNYNWTPPTPLKVWATSNAESCFCFRPLKPL